MTSMIYIREGMTFALSSFITILLIIMLGIQRVKIKLPTVRSIRAYEAISEAVGRCAEMGRPLHFTKGAGTLDRVDKASEVIAGYSLLSHVVKLAIEKGVRVIVTMCVPTEIPLADEILRDNYTQMQRLEEYDSDYSLRFLGIKYFYSTAVLNVFHSEEVASNIMFGQLSSVSAILVGEGQQLGCFQITGLNSTEYLPYFAVCSDYTLIGEELFVAGAIASKDPFSLGCVRGQDMSKILIVIICFIGLILSLAGNDWLINLSKF